MPDVPSVADSAPVRIANTVKVSESESESFNNTSPVAPSATVKVAPAFTLFESFTAVGCAFDVSLSTMVPVADKVSNDSL